MGFRVSLRDPLRVSCKGSIGFKGLGFRGLGVVLLGFGVYLKAHGDFVSRL